MKKKLPSKWCVRVEKDACPEIVREWRKTYCKSFGDYWGNQGYINNVGHHDPHILPGYMEISLKEFERLVLKKEPEDYSYLIELFKRLNIC